MRHFILTFLIMVMLTPSLVCAMPYCEQVPEKSEISADTPCAGHNDSQTNQKLDMGTFMADCMGLDFQKVEITSVDAPQLKSVAVAYANLDDEISLQLDLLKVGSIRGPPDNTVAHLYQTPVFLKTQRIRL